jgi:hypothetical protein
MGDGKNCPQSQTRGIELPMLEALAISTSSAYRPSQVMVFALYHTWGTFPSGLVGSDIRHHGYSFTGSGGGRRLYLMPNEYVKGKNDLGCLRVAEGFLLRKLFHPKSSPASREDGNHFSFENEIVTSLNPCHRERVIRGEGVRHIHTSSRSGRTVCTLEICAFIYPSLASYALGNYLPGVLRMPNAVMILPPTCHSPSSPMYPVPASAIHLASRKAPRLHHHP